MGLGTHLDQLHDENGRLKVTFGHQKNMLLSFLDSLDTLDEKSLGRRNSRTKNGLS